MRASDIDKAYNLVHIALFEFYELENDIAEASGNLFLPFKMDSKHKCGEHKSKVQTNRIAKNGESHKRFFEFPRKAPLTCSLICESFCRSIKALSIDPL